MGSFYLSRFGQVSDLLTLRPDQVAFPWNAREWSRGEVYVYNHQLTSPGGRGGSGQLTGGTVLLRLCDYQPL